jgi:hypothetical protein
VDTIDQKSLRIEANVLSWYLIGAQPTTEIIERYVAANTKLLGNEPSRADQKLLAVAIRHPAFLGPLDVAIAFRQLPCLLKNKLLVMAALLEASPQYVDKFFPASESRWRLAVSLLGIAMRTGLRLLIGVPLLMCIRSRS